MPNIFDLNNKSMAAAQAAQWAGANGKAPTVGQQFGNQVWNGTGFQDPANPNDPQQGSTWAIQGATQNAQKPLYDPETLKSLQSIFGPYFAQQKTNLTQQMGFDKAAAGRQGGAFAAASGLANPGAYTSGAQQRVTQAYAPQFGQLQQNQLGQLLNAAAGSSQFGAQNNQFLANLMMQKSQYDQQQQNQPSIWDYIAGGLAGGVGKATGAALFA